MIGVRGGAAKLNHTVFSSIIQDTVLPFVIFGTRAIEPAFGAFGGLVGFASASAVPAVDAAIQCIFMEIFSIFLDAQIT